ncbi:endonuclease III [Candidatus Gottesmanbacteria bacterium]|nr:endonuclease III [Candidatus Gottesmanbacteria bacterium]
MTGRARAQTILNLLKKAYPNAKIVLTYRNPWELLVAVILSAQCTDVMVNKVTEKLFAKYKTLEDYGVADLTEFEQDIKSTGFYHNKAKNILAAAKLIKEKFGGSVPKTMAELITVPGVARKTANVVLGNAYGIVEGIAVDTHVLRLSQRLGLVDSDVIGGKKILYFQKSNATRSPKSNPTLPPLKVRGGEEGLRGGEGGVSHQFVDYKKDADPVKIEQQLMAVVPKNDWFKLTYLLIDHGRAVCRAQNPNCSGCIVHNLCPASRV